MLKCRKKKKYQLYFYNFQRKQEIPFVIYADFESFTEPIQGCRNNEEKSYTQQHQYHVPSGFCLYIVPFDENIKLGKDIFVYSKKTENEDVAQNLVAIHMKKTSLIFNKPVYLGMCIQKL